MKKRGIFIKVFTYTAIFLILLICVTVALFSQQFMSFYNTSQTQQLGNAYGHFIEQLKGQSEDEMIKLAQNFSSSNQSFQFAIQDTVEERTIFSTPNADTATDVPSGKFTIMLAIDPHYLLRATNGSAVTNDYSSLLSRTLIGFSIMLILGLLGAFIFARQITKPIKQIVDNTKKMANLEDVPPAPERRDELGVLARDVHSMYDKLKDTISKLEEEILREREMEETQRYFFSAASHELKTPIAATGVLLEGMLENVGDYKDHPKYLRECMKMMDAQSKMISEILEIVSLNDGKIVPVPQKIDIGRTIADLLPNYQTLAEANGQRIVTNIPAEQTCLADLKMLKKALSNIILNAVQNTPDGSEIRIWSKPFADQYRLCVLNTDTKIDEAVLPKLFDPFYRMDKARSRKSGRSGLGLTIVQKTLEAMNIDFGLKNTTEGVLFWMDLPEV